MPDRPPPIPPGPHTLASLRGPRNSLAPFYARFRVAERRLLTGHSHQAWPDVARDALVQAYDDAAALVDDKWERAFAQAERVRAGYRRLLDDPDGEIALVGNTHDALVRFLSALPWDQRRRLVTTTGEFHTVRRQLDRLGEAGFGVEIAKVALNPAASAVPRLIETLQKRPDATAAVVVSTVSFESSQIVRDLGALQAACDRAGALLFLDVYHHLNVVPFSVRDEGLGGAFITGGGYKYCQLGEGVAFLRFPRASAGDRTPWRPLITGWFAEFGLLARPGGAGPVDYAAGPDRFAGATYDPISHYRAASVFDFFDRQGLDIGLLREVSQHQIARLCDGFDALGLDPGVITRDRSIAVADRAGFVALASARATDIVAGLRARNVAADARGDVLRLGPAPYLEDRQLDDALLALADSVRTLA
jgi:kynureninase